jgi:hypothetical protein
MEQNGQVKVKGGRVAEFPTVPSRVGLYIYIHTYSILEDEMYMDIDILKSCICILESCYRIHLKQSCIHTCIEELYIL